MNAREMGLRVAVLQEAFAALGIHDKERIKAIMKLTSQIPWYIPEFRGNVDAGELLFPRAVASAINSTTHGTIKPGDIMQAAIDIAGHVTSPQGHVGERQWVRKAKESIDVFGIDAGQMLSVEAPERPKALRVYAKMAEISEGERGGV